MRRKTFGDDALYQSSQYDVYGSLSVNGIALSAVLPSNPLKAASWSYAIDQLAGTGTITLARVVDGISLTPFTGASPLGAAQPMPGSSFEFQTAMVPKGTAATSPDYVTVFEGVIDAVDVSGEFLVLECRDGMARWIDRIIEPPEGDQNGYVVASASMATVLQTIANIGIDVGDPWANLLRLPIVEGDPEWTVVEFWQEGNRSYAEAFHAVVLQRGWAFNYRYHSLQGEGTPTAYEPARTESTDVYNVSLQEIAAYQRLRYDLSRVRNIIEIQYGEDRTRLKTEDTASQLAYGPRYMLFSEEASSQIDTEEEAQRMLEGALADLKDAGVQCDYERMYFWGVELGDTHTLEVDLPRTNASLLLGVIGYTHSLDWRAGGQFRSIIRCENQAVAGKLRWYKTQPRRVHVSLIEPVGMAPEGAEWYQVEDLTFPS